LKQIIAKLLLILIFAAYNYKVVSYGRLSYTTIIFLEDYGCEEEGSKSEIPEGKEEKKVYLEYLAHCSGYLMVIHDSFSHIHWQNIVYSSCDYSLSLYSPPDLAYQDSEYII
jgi:hypothetical protein